MSEFYIWFLILMGVGISATLRRKNLSVSSKLITILSFPAFAIVFGILSSLLCTDYLINKIIELKKKC